MAAFDRLVHVSMFLLVLCAGLIGPIAASAQDRLDPTGVGMARASVATTRGLGAISSNPGALDLLAFQGSPLPFDLTVSLYTLGGTIGSTYISGSEFQQIFGQKPGGITDTERERIGQLLQDEKLFANAAINLLTVRYRTRDGGTIGLYYGHRLYAQVNFPQDLVTLIQTSNIADKSFFEFTTSGVGGTWMTELGVSYGKMFGSLTDVGWFPLIGVGATIKYLQGVAHFDIEDNSIITINQINAGGAIGFIVGGGYRFRTAEPDNFDPGSTVSSFLSGLFPSTSGSGVGGDIGISGVLYRKKSERPEGGTQDAVFFGMALMNAGSITWNTNANERLARIVNDTLKSSAVSNEQFDRYIGELTPVDDFSTPTPMTFRAGVGCDVAAFMPDLELPLLVELEGEAPLNDAPGNANDPRMALGADWHVSNEFSVRSGISIGGVSGFGLGLGAGWRPVEWLAIDAGTGELNALFNGKRVDAAIRASVGFRP